ncbi:MAG: ATP-binding cassette domain-containing protein, partial [Acidimicrobiales bacterium]
MRSPVDRSPLPGAPGGTRPLLHVAGVTKSFGGISAVSGVTFSVERGQSVGLVGPNGAGKTTLFNCICGQLKPEEGLIELDGKALGSLPT